MRINGKEIAENIYNDLRNRVGDLKKIGITPCLTVILVGDDPASVAYVNQKQKWGSSIGAEIITRKYPLSVTNETLIKKVKQLNTDPSVHAILIQRPLPSQIDIPTLELAVNPRKDIDGFHPASPFTFPLPLAVVKILEEIYKIKNNPTPKDAEDGEFHSWLSNQKIVILGKGPTGGGPVLKYFKKLGTNPTLIDSKTIDPDSFIKNADIIISAVGKPDIITPEKIKKGVILISVGIFRGEDGLLHGDYDEQKIEKKAAYFTPTPGGVGPVNVAMLMQNLVTAAEKQN